MKNKGLLMLISLLNMVFAIVGIFLCAVYSKVSGFTGDGFIPLGILLLAISILLFVSSNMKTSIFAKVMRIIISAIAMVGLMIFAIVSISEFSATGAKFDIFLMLYSLFGLVGFAFSVLNFIYSLINLKGNSHAFLVKAFNICLIVTFAGILFTYVGWGIYDLIVSKAIFPFHGTVITLGIIFNLLISYFSDPIKVEDKKEEQPQA